MNANRPGYWLPRSERSKSERTLSQREGDLKDGQKTLVDDQKTLATDQNALADGKKALLTNGNRFASERSMASRYIESLEARIIRLEKRESIWIGMALFGIGSGVGSLIAKVLHLW